MLGFIRGQLKERFIRCRKTASTPYTALDVAEYFLSKSKPGTEWGITLLKLQHLVYYAQAWYLAIRHEGQLFSERIEASERGPKCRSVYEKYRDYGFDEIPAATHVRIFPESIREVLDAVWEVYGHRSARWLEQKSNREEPVIRAQASAPPTVNNIRVIDVQVMEDFYSNLLNQAGTP
jgi:uncharacterized phage-associated protein